MSQRYILGLVVAILIAFSPDIADLQETGLHSTSPLFSNEESPVGQPLVVGPAASGIITFGEYPAGTSDRVSFLVVIIHLSPLTEQIQRARYCPVHQDFEVLSKGDS